MLADLSVAYVIFCIFKLQNVFIPAVDGFRIYIKGGGILSFVFKVILLKKLVLKKISCQNYSKIFINKFT